MPLRGSRLAACLLIALPAAAQQWVRLATPHFEMYTTSGVKRGREAILHFEEVRNFFLQVSPSKRTSEFPVRIIAFRSDKEYKPYRISESAAAYYAATHKRDYIVMPGVTEEYFPASIHEYMHLVIRHSGLKLPVWFNEGWADLFSTLRPSGKKAVVGDVIPGRVRTLMSEKWIPLATLGGIDQSSAHYNESAKADLFYAESWGLTHMLFLADEFRPKFDQFLAALVRTQNLETSLQAAYGKPVSFFETEMETYFRRYLIRNNEFDVKLEKADQEVVSSAVTPAEADIVLGDLLAAINRREQAKIIFERISATGVATSDVEEALGYLAWQANDREAARRHFRRAIEIGTKDAQLCFHLAMLDAEAGLPDAAIIPHLEKAVELKSDYMEAALRLGIAKNNTHDFEGALKVLEKVHPVDDRDSFQLFYAVAYAQAHRDDPVAARSSAIRAQKLAATPEEAKLASEMLLYLDSRTKNQAR
jgi:tetratricopeptide (TPR) repeat protein